MPGTAPTVAEIQKMGLYRLKPYFDDHLHKKRFALACARHPEIDVPLEVSQRRDAHPDALAELSKHPDLGIVRRIALNESAPPKVLRELSSHPDRRTRNYANSTLQRIKKLKALKR